MKKTIFAVISAAIILSGCQTTNQNHTAKNTAANTQTAKHAGGAINFDSRLSHSPRTLDMFKPGYNQCYDRNVESYTFVIDSHNHFRPFGGNAIPMYELSDYFKRLGVLFVNIYGIGQTLPVDTDCEYYLDCPEEPVIPNIKNDFRNASNYLEYTPTGQVFTLSMSFPDLAQPQYIQPQIQQLDVNYTNMFKWMGEANLVKQALFPNGHQPATIQNINDYGEFMQTLRERDIPIAIHSDLGCDPNTDPQAQCNDEPLKYLPLMDHLLKTYPDNKIVWVHMGLSRELTTLDVDTHIELMSGYLDTYPNLMLDISWDVIWDAYFSIKEKRDKYVVFLNQYSTRILPGTDFVASRDKSYESYAKALQDTSMINLYINNEAFRNIALGENYFRIRGLQDEYTAPQICK